MARICVLYDTGEGQTARIAERVSATLEVGGHDVALVHARHLPPGFALGDYDAVIVGASVHRGKHQKSIRRFVADNAEALNEVPSAFLSVSLSAAGEAESQAAAEEIITDFLTGTGWRPDQRRSVAGALKYSEYGPLTKFVLKRIAQKEGGDTDTSRDYEYTDWERLETFAADFGAHVAESVETTGA